MEHIQELNPMSSAMTRVEQGRQNHFVSTSERDKHFARSKGVQFKGDTAWSCGGTCNTLFPSISNEEVGSPFTYTSSPAYESM